MGYRKEAGKAAEKQRTEWAGTNCGDSGAQLNRGYLRRASWPCLWAALSGRFSSGNEMFYLLFLPLILVAVRRGLRGATAAILALDTGIILALRLYQRSYNELTLLQFLMLILSLAGLVLGALISERDESEQKLSEEEARMRLLLESTGEAIYGVNNRANGHSATMRCSAVRLQVARGVAGAKYTRRDTPYAAGRNAVSARGVLATDGTHGGQKNSRGRRSCYGAPTGAVSRPRSGVTPWWRRVPVSGQW